MSRHVPYPDEPKKYMLNKKEFLPVSNTTKTCESTTSKLNLSEVQSFVAAFMGPLTPYKSMLLFHGVGVGKTCAAIQIAEAHSESKHTIVISPQTTKSGFKSNIINARRAPLNESGHVDFPALSRSSCTGSTYTAASHSKKLTRAELKNIANQRISTRYRFMGYEQFSNSVEYLLDQIREKFPNIPDDKIEKEFAKTIKEIYSDRVMIIDEAHNLRSSSKNTEMTTLDYVRLIIRYAKNIHLVLLSATPMYNRHNEIVDLLNLLLLNDRKPQLSDDIFDNTGNLTPKGKVQLIEAVSGRVSYMRGDTPETFPLRISSTKAGITKPYPPAKMDTNGNDIRKEKLLETSQLHFTELSKLQMDAYKTLDGYDGSIKMTSTLQQLCNVYFNGINVSEEGFRSVFRLKGSESKLRVQYKSQRILSKQNIQKYSPKFADIVSRVSSCDGSAFVYSRYKWSGIIPLAIAFEEAGFLPVTGKPLLMDAKGDPNTAPRYAMISSEDNFGATGMSIGGIVSRLNDENTNIKVVLGTLKASEGLDFKRIREVHVVDPFYHFSITEQVIGRSIRFCSHASLPIDKRNVTIYLHCSGMSSSPNRIETIDEHLYRLSFNKLAKIGQITKILKENAIDCPILRQKLYIPNVGRRQITTSQGKSMMVDIGDVDGSAICDYGKCSYPCPKQPVVSIDYSTFHPYFKKHAVDMMGWDIKFIMTDNPAMTYSEISDRLGNPDDMVLSLTLDSLLNPLVGPKWLGDSTMVYVSNVYILIPSTMINATFTMSDVREQNISKIEDSKIL